MPYKVSRVSNSQGSGKRKVPPVEVPVEVPVDVAVEVPLEVSVEVPLEVPSLEVVQEEVQEEVMGVPFGEPRFNEDKTKVLNPLSNRYVKVGGDIDKKLNLSGI